MDATSNSAGRRLRTRKRSRSPSPLLSQPPPVLRRASSRPERYRDHHYRGERCGSGPSSPPYHGGCRESLPRRSPSPRLVPPPPSPLLPVSSRPERYLVHDGCGRGSPTYSPYRGGHGQSLPRNSPSMPLKRSRLGDEYGGRRSSSGERFVDLKQDYDFLTPRGAGGSHDYMGGGPRSGRCLNCGLEGHWARDCNAGDWKNKGYFSGERDHVETNCQSSPKNLKRGRSNSRLPSPCRERSQSRSYSRGRRYSDPNSTGEKPLTEQSLKDTTRMNYGNVDEVRPVRRYKRSFRRYTWQNRTAHRIPVLSGRRQEPRECSFAGDCSYFSTVAAMESQLRLLCAFPEELSISYIKKKDKKMKQLNGYKRMGKNQRLLKILKEVGIPRRLDYRAYCQGEIMKCHMYKIAGHVEYHLSRRGDIRRALTNHFEARTDDCSISYKH